MTNEVAIKAIQDFIGWFKEDSLIRKALEMAIEALSQEPCRVKNELNVELNELKPCTDAVSRQAVLDNSWELEYPDGTSERVVSVKDIEQLSSVNSQKSGVWILLDECANSGYYCSECHKKLVKEGWSKTVKKIKYCPNCGCAMKGE